MRLQLPNVTLIAFGTTQIDGMRKALDYSSKDIEFGAVKLIDSVPCNSIDEWNYNIIYRLWEFVDTEFALLVHPDGFVVHPESWRDEFLNYDFVGAPWPLPTDSYSYRDEYGNIVRVGNSVSLRSQKILQAPKAFGLEWKSFYGNTNEDGFLTCHNRKRLEAIGCTFAPLEVAKYFSRETEIPENRDVDQPFAFHKHAGRNSNYPNFEV